MSLKLITSKQKLIICKRTISQGYDDRNETVDHMIRKYGKLVQKQRKTKPNWEEKGINWELCKRLKFDYAKRYYMHKPESF